MYSKEAPLGRSKGGFRGAPTLSLGYVERRFHLSFIKLLAYMILNDKIATP